MKLNLFLLSFLFLLFASCNKDETKTSSELGGDPDIELNVVGNTFSPSSLNIGGTYVAVPSDIKILSSDNGVNTIQFIVDLSQAPELALLNSLIPASLKDTQGRINLETQVKMTSEGMLDYSNSDHAPFVAVRYDCKVGDVYTLEKSDGSTVTRTVLSKSTTDDFPWGFLNIKTIQVEQAPGFAGISKYVFHFNHKFGLVSVAIHAEDGSSMSTLIYPTYP